MIDDNTKRNYLKIIIIILFIITVAILINFLMPHKTILEVEAPEIIFVGESKNLKIKSNKDFQITNKYGYIVTDDIYYKKNNNTVSIIGVLNGNETLTIKADDIIKNVDVLVCKNISLQKPSFELLIGETQEIEFGLEEKCLSQYNISIKDDNIATYQDGAIIGKNIGTTTLTFSHANENTNYTINVTDKELSFDINETELKINETYDIPLINRSGNHVCSTDSDTISITTSNEGCSIKTLKEGKATIKAIDRNRTIEATVTIKKPIVEVENITLDTKAIRLAKGKTHEIKAKIVPENATDKTITYTSNNTNIATISNGKIEGLGYGATTIEAKTSNGKKATISVVVTGDKLIDSYDSKTLKYWIEQRKSTYIVTHIWMEDAYSQFKTAITSPKSSSSPIPRIPQNGKTIITNTINEKKYQNKGLIGFNASAMVSSSFGKRTPSSWMGTSQLPLILHDGKIIRDSSSEQINTDDTYVTYGLKKDGNLAYYKFNKGSSSDDRNRNKTIANNIINDGVLYTFGFKPVLLENYQVVAEENAANIRQAICQVDKENFIIITNTNSTNNRQAGLGFNDLAKLFKSLNCKTALNLDGGGSTCGYYKKNTNDLKQLPTTYSGRNLSDMIYFVEK